MQRGLLSRLDWLAGRNHEEGVDRGVFYPRNGSAEPWDGLTSVNQSEPDLRELVRYRDGVKTVNVRSEGSFVATIEAYTYPETLSSRVPFGFSYRVLTENGYRIHIVYNAKAKMSGHTYQIDSVDPFGFDISTTPVYVPEAKPTAHLMIDTEIAYPWTIKDLEDVLYGSDTSLARLPMPEEIIDIFEVNAILKVIDNGDGTFTLDGPNTAIQMLTSDEFQVDWPSVRYLDEDTYQIKSL